MSAAPTTGRPSLLGGRDASWLALPAGLLAGDLALTFLLLPDRIASLVADTLFTTSL